MFFQEFANMSKINHMKKVIEDLNVFRNYFRAVQEVSDEIQTSISFIKYELQNSIETNISYKKLKNKLLDGQKNLIMNPMGKQITKKNTTSENIIYLVDNKQNYVST